MKAFANVLSFTCGALLAGFCVALYQHASSEDLVGMGSILFFVACLRVIVASEENQ